MAHKIQILLRLSARVSARLSAAHRQKVSGLLSASVFTHRRGSESRHVSHMWRMASIVFTWSKSSNTTRLDALKRYSNIFNIFKRKCKHRITVKTLGRLENFLIFLQRHQPSSSGSLRMFEVQGQVRVRGTPQEPVTFSLLYFIMKTRFHRRNLFFHLTGILKILRAFPPKLPGWRTFPQQQTFPGKSRE